MINLKLDGSGDIFARNYRLARVSENDQIAQRIGTRLKLLLGEWFLDTGAGVPWFQQILIKSPRRAIVTGIIKRTILQTPGVDALASFSIDEIENRAIVVQFRVTTTSGDTVANSVQVG